MSYPIYYVEESDTLPILFDSFDGGTGASITMTGLAVTDIEIYKDGSTTQRASDAGYTLLDTDGIDFDSITGIHGFSIDLSDNTDAGFYAVGSWYHVVVSSITVDAQTVNFVAAAFRIVSATRGMAGTALPDAAADAAGGLPISDAGGLDLDTQIGTDIDAILTDTADMQPKLGTPAGASISADIATVDSNVDAILVDTADMQPKLGTPAGASISADIATVDSNVDAILVDTGTTLPATLGTPAGASMSADIATIDGNVDAILVDTGTTLDTKLNDIQGATFSSATDSLEAIRDRGDAAWTTGAGGSDRLLMVDTTIATLSSQTSFTLTAGSTDDDAYNNCTIVIEDVSTSTQKAVGLISDYTGSTKTVTLKYDPAIFTMAATDKVYILAENSLKSTDQNRQLDVTATGAAGIDWANIENPTTAVDLSGTDIQLVDTATAVTNQVTADVTAVSGDSTAADNLELDYDGTGYAKTNSTVGTVSTLTGHTVQTGDNFARLGAPAGASVSADIAALNDISAADVNAQVLDVMNTDTFAEPSSVPAATASLVDKIGWLMALARNKITQTATTATLRNDADGADIATSTVSDDGTTATRGEWT